MFFTSKEYTNPSQTKHTLFTMAFATASSSTTDQSSPLTSIHQSVLWGLLEDDAASLARRRPLCLSEELSHLQNQRQAEAVLGGLRRRRIALCAILREKRLDHRRRVPSRPSSASSSSLSLANERSDLRRRRRRLEERPYLNRTGSFVKGGPYGLSTTAATTKAISTTPGMKDLRWIRHSRLLAAAHRLAGISATASTNTATTSSPSDEELEEEQQLALHLDVCVHGTFVACHHIVLELVVADDKWDSSHRHSGTEIHEDDDRQGEGERPLLYLRLKSHTLPPALSGEVRRWFGTEAAPTVCLGQQGSFFPMNPAELERTLSCHQLRRSIRTLHRTCVAYAVRVQALQHLLLLQAPRRPSALFGKDLGAVVGSDSRMESNNGGGSKVAAAMDATTAYYVDKVSLTDEVLSFRIHVAHVEVVAMSTDGQRSNVEDTRIQSDDLDADSDDDDVELRDRSRDNAVPPSTPLGPNCAAIRASFDIEWPTRESRPTGGSAKVARQRGMISAVPAVIEAHRVDGDDREDHRLDDPPIGAAVVAIDDHSDDEEGRHDGSQLGGRGGVNSDAALGALAAELLGRIPARQAVECVVANLLLVGTRN